MANATPGTLHLGTSGYQYDHWRGVFYPEDLPKDEWFGRYAERFDSVEINNTFYQLPEAETFDDWRERAPEGFCYAVKFSRYGSHMKKLKDPEGTIGTFLERAERLEDRLGPILVQLPPHWGADPERLAAFLDAAPSAHRWAVEVRDPSWLCAAVFDVLRDHGAALCLHDMIDDHPRELTADWLYLRYHGEDYAGGYSPQRLSAEADRIAAWLDDGLDVFAYFNNDLGGHAVEDAGNLARYLDHRLSG